MRGGEEKRMISEDEAIALLRKYASSEKDFQGVLVHSMGVRDFAVEIAEKVNSVGALHVDLEFIKVASILHDIGRFQVPPGNNSGAHGYIGGQILKKEGLDKRFIRVCERHVGYWIAKKEIAQFSIHIPIQEYKPETPEELIVSYADKRFGYRERKSLQQVIDRYAKELGKEYAERIKELHKLICGMADQPI